MPNFTQLLSEPYGSFGLFAVTVIGVFCCLVVYRGFKAGDWDFMND
jgi:hypothetical protein